MHKALLGVLLAWSLALAGCSGGSDGHDVVDVTCPDGTVLTADEIEADEHHHEAGFNATKDLCPVAPKVTLSGLPDTIQVYDSAAFTWAVDAGSAAKGHSMLTSIRYAKASIPDADLVEGQMAKYPTEIIKKEHQDLPVTFKGNMTFNEAGKVYIRAYAQVQGEGLQRRDVWSAEVVLEVLPVNATGVIQTIRHGLGPAGELDPASADLKLGDAIQFANDDLLEHSLNQVSAPAGAASCELSAGQMATSASTCVLTVPGTYEFETTGDAMAKSVTINVSKA
jgi:plastocyanin